MGISQSLPMTGYAKMIDIWMIFTISYPFIVITLHCLQKVALERKIIRINVESTGRIVDKFALLWGEAQLCLPYVCL